MRFLVPDGSHVNTDIPYAEVEVMKMCMPLLSPASGTIRFKLSEGSAMMVRQKTYFSQIDHCRVSYMSLNSGGNSPPPVLMQSSLKLSG